jgi:predicted Fe-Mo cluster-binding NifX family protein
MRIAIPTANGKLCMHFGHCELFSIIEVDENEKKITGREDVTPPPHEPGVLPRFLGEQKVSLIIAGGMGGRAQSLFTEQNIDVIIGAPAETPETIVNAYLNGSLQTGPNACSH